MKIGIVSELTGGADICHAVANLTTISANAYLRQGETVLFSLSSAKEEYSFTNEALILIKGDSAMSTKRLVERFDYVTETISSILFETAGLADRDCEIKFTIGNKNISIDVAKAEEASAQKYYRVLFAISRQQAKNKRQWEFARQAVDLASKSMRLGDAGGKALPDIATETLHWLQESFAKYNPVCYKDVITIGLEG